MQKGSALLLLLILFVIIGIVLVMPVSSYNRGPCLMLVGAKCPGWVLGDPLWKRLISSSGLTPKSQPQNPVVILAPQPSLSPVDETASWKTYINNIFGYEIKYPADWHVAGPYGGQAGYDCLENPENVTVAEFSKTKLTDCGFLAEQLPPQDADVTIWVDNREWGKLNILSEPYKDISVAGEKAIKYVFTEKSQLPNIQATRIYFNHNNKGYLIFLKQTDKKGSYDPIYDQVLSTFKFLDQENFEGKPCGGFAGEQGQFTCPDGYKCEYPKPMYPDAQGKCVKK